MEFPICKEGAPSIPPTLVVSASVPTSPLPLIDHHVASSILHATLEGAKLTDEDIASDVDRVTPIVGEQANIPEVAMENAASAEDSAPSSSPSSSDKGPEDTNLQGGDLVKAVEQLEL